jgi:hypothetical protein
MLLFRVVGVLSVEVSKELRDPLEPCTAQHTDRPPEEPRIHSILLLWVCHKFAAVPLPLRAHTRAHTLQHTHTHAHTHARARTHAHTRTHVHIHARAHPHTRTTTHAHIHARAHARTHARAHGRTGRQRPCVCVKRRSVSTDSRRTPNRTLSQRSGTRARSSHAARNPPRSTPSTHRALEVSLQPWAQVCLLRQVPRGGVARVAPAHVQAALVAQSSARVSVRSRG